MEQTGESAGVSRSEAHRARCGGHLGRVLEDSPQPRGLRDCVDSASLEFVPASAAAAAHVASEAATG